MNETLFSKEGSEIGPKIGVTILVIHIQRKNQNVLLRGKKNEEEIRKDRNLLGLFEFLKTFVANQKIPVALTRYQVTIFQIKGN
jgi:hypothetical protein